MHNQKYLHLLLWFFLEEKSKLWKIFARTWRYVLSIHNTWSIMKTYEDLSHNQNGIPLERSEVVKTTRFFDKSAVASMNVCCTSSHQNNLILTRHDFLLQKADTWFWYLNSWSKLRIYGDFTLKKILLLSVEINSQKQKHSIVQN